MTAIIFIAAAAGLVLALIYHRNSGLMNLLHKATVFILIAVVIAAFAAVIYGRLV